MKEAKLGYYATVFAESSKQLCDNADRISLVSDIIKTELEKIGLRVEDVEFRINVVKNCVN